MQIEEGWNTRGGGSRVCTQIVYPSFGESNKYGNYVIYANHGNIKFE